MRKPILFGYNNPWQIVRETYNDILLGATVTAAERLEFDVPSFTYSLGEGADRILIACINYMSYPSGAGSYPNSVSSVTIDGVGTMTKLYDSADTWVYGGDSSNIIGEDYFQFAIYYRSIPSGSSATVNVTMSQECSYITFLPFTVNRPGAAGGLVTVDTAERRTTGDNSDPPPVSQTTPSNTLTLTNQNLVITMGANFTNGDADPYYNGIEVPSQYRYQDSIVTSVAEFCVAFSTTLGAGNMTFNHVMANSRFDFGTGDREVIAGDILEYGIALTV